MICSNVLNSREKPGVSSMSGSPTFNIDKYKKNRNGANLQLRHALRAGGVTRPICSPMKGFVIFDMVSLASFADFSFFSHLVLSRSFLRLKRNHILNEKNQIKIT